MALSHETQSCHSSLPRSNIWASSPVGCGNSAFSDKILLLCSVHFSVRAGVDSVLEFIFLFDLFIYVFGSSTPMTG